MVLADSAVGPDQVLDIQEALPDCYVVAFKESELKLRAQNVSIECCRISIP